jgi:hypothetical protein
LFHGYKCNFLNSKDFYHNGLVHVLCLPSQLCQISIDSDQVSGKLKHVISSYFLMLITQFAKKKIRPSNSFQVTNNRMAHRPPSRLSIVSVWRGLKPPW